MIPVQGSWLGSSFYFGVRHRDNGVFANPQHSSLDKMSDRLQEISMSVKQKRICDDKYYRATKLMSECQQHNVSGCSKSQMFMATRPPSRFSFAPRRNYPKGERGYH